jgi:hypothetical protein
MLDIPSILEAPKTHERWVVGEGCCVTHALVSMWCPAWCPSVVPEALDPSPDASAPNRAWP